LLLLKSRRQQQQQRPQHQNASGIVKNQPNTILSVGDDSECVPKGASQGTVVVVVVV